MASSWSSEPLAAAAPAVASNAIHFKLAHAARQHADAAQPRQDARETFLRGAEADAEDDMMVCTTRVDHDVRICMVDTSLSTTYEMRCMAAPLVPVSPLLLKASTTHLSLSKYSAL